MKSEKPQHSECWLHLLVFREASMETFQMEVLGRMIHQSGADSGFTRAVRNTIGEEGSQIERVPHKYLLSSMYYKNLYAVYRPI